MNETMLVTILMQSELTGPGDVLTHTDMVENVGYRYLTEI